MPKQPTDTEAEDMFHKFAMDRGLTVSIQHLEPEPGYDDTLEVEPPMWRVRMKGRFPKSADVPGPPFEPNGISCLVHRGETKAKAIMAAIGYLQAWGFPI